MDTTIETALFRKVWDEENLPPGFFNKIPKKGDLGKCANYRGITLLLVPGKVLKRIILDRMKGV